MVLKRQLKEGGEEDSQLPNKRRHFVSNIFKGLNHGRTLQESVSCLEPIIRNWVKEAVDHALDPYLRSSRNQAECGSSSLQLQFHSKLPHTLFTASRVVSEDKSPIKVVLFDSCSNQIVSSGPLSSLKVTIVVLDGDFETDDQEGWTKKEFERKTVKNREGKRPLVTGGLVISLQNGVGYVGDVSFTDNSSWIRSGKFRLGAKAHAASDEISIREAMTNAFKVKDHRGESYQKHYPPSLDDEVWRLKLIAKDGASHKKLTRCGISSVRDFLRLFITDEFRLRAILDKVSNKQWETIIGHATTCPLDDKKYVYRAPQGTMLLFNSIYKVVGVTFDGQNYHPLNGLNMYQMRMVEDLKQHAYKNPREFISVCDPFVAGQAMLLASPEAESFTSPHLGLDGVSFQGDQPTISPPYKTEADQDNSSFELGESSHPIQVFNPTFRNSFGLSDSLGGFYHHWIPGGDDYMNLQLSTDDLPIDDNFQVKSSPSPWQGNGLFLDPTNHEIGIISSNSGILIPRHAGKPRTRWCKVLAVVKWRILVRRNVAARKWKQFYNYM